MSKHTLVQLSLHALDRDFRRELLRAAARAGDRAIHIECSERIIAHEIDGAGEAVCIGQDFDEIAGVARSLDQRNLLVLTGFGSVNSRTGMSVSALFRRSSRIYDIIDDLSYGTRGLRYLRFLVRDTRWRLHCARTLVLEHGMQKRYRSAQHLDNASHLEPHVQTEDIRLVYIGSIDERLDLDIIEALGEMFPLDIFGRAHPKWPDAYAQLQRVVERTSNIRLMGSYDNDHLSDIFKKYSHGVVPYKVNHRLTKHINPDKIYHYLNFGLAAISSAIPQALKMVEHLSVYRPNADVYALVEDAKDRKLTWRWTGNTWDARWRQLKGKMTGASSAVG